MHVKSPSESASTECRLQLTYLCGFKCRLWCRFKHKMFLYILHAHTSNYVLTACREPASGEQCLHQCCAADTSFMFQQNWSIKCDYVTGKRSTDNWHCQVDNLGSRFVLLQNSSGLMCVIALYQRLINTRYNVYSPTYYSRI